MWIEHNLVFYKTYEILKNKFHIIMRLNEKAKTLREEKKLSQSYLAHELGLEQSQYSRREKGEIQFVPDEIVKLSKLLETTISNLFDEQANIFSIQTQNGGYFGQYITVSDN